MSRPPRLIHPPGPWLGGVLNIPTCINLYGCGYRNVYALDELVNVNDRRIAFEGTVVEPKPKLAAPPDAR